MLVEKEIIAPGQYWYVDEATGLPRKLDVTSQLTKYWHEQGSKMLGLGLTVPVPFEHDFGIHPMTPKDKLLNNAGEVKEYRLKDFDDPKRGKVKDALFGIVDIQDPDAKRKVGHSIRWTSPWINSFTDGDGRQWNNVISHLALTTRPRITKQAPFGSIAAALSLASETKIDPAQPLPPGGGFCLSRVGALALTERGRSRPLYPVAFSLFSGVALGEDDLPPPKKKSKEGGGDGGGGGDKPPAKPKEGGGGDGGGGNPPPSDGEEGEEVDTGMESFADKAGDVGMEQMLCDLLGALGIHVECSAGEAGFKRSLYNATMTKIFELTSKAQPNAQTPRPGQPPAPAAGQGTGASPNPLIQQEQQPMYMSLEDINKIADPTVRSIALGMYTENQKLRSEVEASTKTANSLRDAKLKEATAQRTSRLTLLGRLSPRVKSDLDAMAANPSMALSMGDGGAVIDPMAQTLEVLEKGLADLPKLLMTDTSALSVQPQPTDADVMSQERADEVADSMARMMGCPPQAKKAS